jgi:hypothetical protein
MDFSEPTSSHACLGFSRDNGKTITILNIPAPANLSWVDENTFFMARGVEDRVVISKVVLDAENMTWQEKEESIKAGAKLDMRGLRASLVYVTGRRIFVNANLLCLLPEEIMRPVVDGNWLACVSNSGRKVYILSDKGEVIGTRSCPIGS